MGNNGAGIALIGDQGSRGQKWKAWHWVLQHNQFAENRWGIYGQFADWIVLSGNRFSHNSAADVQWAEGVTRVTELPDHTSDAVPAHRSPVQVTGPEV
ncbi:MAG: hypothetical protein ACKON9_30505, partial [Planctomycetaceae bacterium]